jgi:hemolysin activation/secretion protein
MYQYIISQVPLFLLHGLQLKILFIGACFPIFSFASDFNSSEYNFSSSRPELEKNNENTQKQTISSAMTVRVLDVKVHELRPFERGHPLAQTQWEALNARLQMLVSDPNNDLLAISQDLTNLYRSFGYLVAQVGLEDEDIQYADRTGVLRWRVLEGIYGQVEVILDEKTGAWAGATEPTLRRLKLMLTQAICGKASEVAHACMGEVVQAQRDKSGLERGLLLANELPDAQVDMPEFSAGQDIGQTNAIFRASSRNSRHNFALEQDNHGGQVTGVVRTGWTYGTSNLLGLAEVFSFNRMQTNQQQNNDSVFVSLPMGYDGWRISLAQAQMQYTLGGGFEGVATGQSQTHTVAVVYPLVRRFNRTVRLSASYSRSQNKTDYYDGLLHAHSNNDRYSLSLQEDLDEIRQSSMPFIPSHTLWNTTLSQGRIRLDADSLAADQAGPKVAGNYSKLSYSLMRKQSLTNDNRWAVNLSWRGQLASKNLDGSEKLSLGGVYGVRAYPGGEVSSDVAHLFSIDLKRQFANSTRNGFWAFGGFFDYGHGQLAKSEWTQGATDVYTVSAYGLSLDGAAKWSGSWGTSHAQFGLIWAHRGMPKNSGIEPNTKARTWMYAKVNL